MSAPEVKVTQADREAAASANGYKSWDEFLNGTGNAYAQSQARAFARHRQSAQTETLAVLEQAQRSLEEASNRLSILSATELARGKPATAAKIAQWEGEALQTLTTLTDKIEEMRNGRNGQG